MTVGSRRPWHSIHRYKRLWSPLLSTSHLAPTSAVWVLTLPTTARSSEASGPTAAQQTICVMWSRRTAATPDTVQTASSHRQTPARLPGGENRAGGELVAPHSATSIFAVVATAILVTRTSVHDLLIKSLMFRIADSDFICSSRILISFSRAPSRSSPDDW